MSSIIIRFNILNKQYMLKAENINAIFLFGSVARDDYDEYSDIDIFILIEDCLEEDYQKFKINFAEQLCMPIDWISLYRKSTIENMAKYGSYFLWHIKVEGIKLFEEGLYFSNILNCLIRYNRVKNDIMEYKEICKDIKNSLAIDDFTIKYELNLIASIIRNTSIAILFMNNKYFFGRVTPVKLCLEILDSKLDFNIDDYIKLYKYRLFYTRNNKQIYIISVDKNYVEFWLKNANDMLDFAMEFV